MPRFSNIPTFLKLGMIRDPCMSSELSFVGLTHLSISEGYDEPKLVHRHFILVPWG